MEDLSRAPGDGDRKPIRERISQAIKDGRISAVDGDIRLGNVQAAQSLTELSLIVRDLDQLDATFAVADAAHPMAAPVTTVYGIEPTTPTASPGRVVPLLILGFVFSLVVAGGIAVFVFNGIAEKDVRAQPTSETGEGPGSQPSPKIPAPVGVVDPEAPEVSEPVSFDLSRAGVTSFIDTYRKKFGTTRVTDLTMYGDYVVVQVPVPGKSRHSGWLYRDGQWTDFGGISADFPGTAVVNLSQLDVAAMMRNLQRAKRTLKVEEINQNYVVINYRPQFDDAPNVNIYVSNEYRESGYLATTLDGKVERAYPFGG